MKRGKSRFDMSQLRITRGAMVILGLEIGLSLVWLMSGKDARATIGQYVAASPSTVWEQWYVWTLATSAFLEPNFIGLILHAMVLWMFVPTLERFWGTTRFYKFVAVTSIAGTLVGTLTGLATGHDVPIVGLNPFIYASIVAFGITYAKQPVQFWGVLPLTGRQLMYGFMAFIALFVVLQQKWEEGAGFAGAMVAAAVMTSKKWNPGLAYRRWKAQRARAQLTILQGGQSGPFAGKPTKPKAKPTDGGNWLN